MGKALKLAKPDIDWMMFEKQRSEAAATKELRALARQLDTSKSGRISREELMTMAEDRRIRHLFQLFDIDIADVDLFYEMMTDVQLLIYQTKLLQSSVSSLCHPMRDVESSPAR